MKLYEEINFKGLDWYYLGEENGIATLLLKNVLDEDRIKKYYDGDDVMISGHDVRHQDNIREYDWDKSYIKNVILPNFLKDLSVDGTLDLLTKEEVEELPWNIRECDDWYWTKSKNSSTRFSAFFVITSGYVSSNYSNGALAGRPVLRLSANQLFSDNDGDNNLVETVGSESARKIIEEEKKIPEKIKIDSEDRIQALSTGNFVYKVNQPAKNIIYKINEIIDYLKSKGEQ